MLSDDDHPDPSGPEQPDDDNPRAEDGRPPLRSVSGGNGGSAMDRGDAAEGAGDDDGEDKADGGEEKDGQFTFFTYENGRKIGLGQLVQRGTPVEVIYEAKGRTLSNVSSAGMFDPFGPPVAMVGDFVVGSYKPTYLRDQDGQVEKVKLYGELKPRRLQSLGTEAGKVLLEELQAAIAKQQKSSAA